MKRRKFLINGLGMAAGTMIGSQWVDGMVVSNYSESFVSTIPVVLLERKKSKFSHRLPATDQNYKRLNNYIEDDPIPEYDWASDEAYERFLDMKYGVRIHWGIYSIWNLTGESWPFLGNRNPDIDFEKKQEYQSLYKTWNPSGFDAEEWMETFSECGFKMFAFTTKHHEGFSMFDTKTRVKRRPNWTANFMVGIGPDENGRFSPTAISQLKQVGRWMKRNGEGIYATRAREGELWKEGDQVRYTRSKDEKTIFVHCFEWPGKVLVLNTVKPKKRTKIYLLGHEQPLTWKLNEQEQLEISVPTTLKDQIPEEMQLAYTFKISKL